MPQTHHLKWELISSIKKDIDECALAVTAAYLT